MTCKIEGCNEAEEVNELCFDHEEQRLDESEKEYLRYKEQVESNYFSQFDM